jgi:hypothetical protein
VLFCNESTHSDAWIAGAQDELIVLLQSVFGGFDLQYRRVSGCLDKLAILDSIACIERDQLPRARCYAKFCDFWRHRELFHKGDDDDDDNDGGCHAPDTAPHAEKHRESRVCHTLQQWSAIGIDKLYSAYDAFDAGNFTNATSLACVAELVLRLVTERLPPTFDDGASYRHRVFPAKLAAFDMLGLNNDTNDLIVGTRTVRSFRRAPDAAGKNHTLIATYIVARVLQRSIDEADAEQQLGGTTQLLWPLAGVIAPFDRTGLPPKSVCSVNGAASNLGANDSAALLPNISVLHDFAAVSDEFKRCSSFPDHRLRRYDSLLPGGCCSTVVLMTDIDDHANGTRIEPRRESLGYVAHYQSKLVFEDVNASSADPLIEKFLIARVAAPDLCNDVASVSMPDVPPSTGNSSFNSTSFGGRVALAGTVGSSTHWRAPREGLPITLPPGESRCVGGEKPGAVCSMQSECGKGRTCKVKPGAAAPITAYCYDRFGWQEDEPCVFDGELTECPYGYCYGAADGHEGGAYPLLYYYQSCYDPLTNDADECDEEMVNWFKYPALDSIQ